MFKSRTAKKAEAPMTDPYKWTGEEVCMFLDALNMGAYKQSFKSQEITGDILIDLGESDLFTLKITSASERAKLLLAIQQLKAKWGRQVDGKDDASEHSQSSSSQISDHSGSTASSQKSASKEVMFKCHYGDENRMIKGHAPLTWEKVSRKIRQAFGHRMVVKYVDKQNDLISVKTEEEFQTMISEFGFGSTIKLQLDRKRKTSALKDSDTAILETMLNPVVVIDQSGTMQFANTACTKMLGYSKKELIGANVKILMHSAIADRHDGYIAEYLRTGNAKVIGKGRIVEARRKDGTTLQVELAVSHTKSHRRDVFTGTFSEVQRDAPHSPTSAAAAANSDAAMAGLTAGFALLENLLFAAVVADQRGIILFANSNAAKLFGWEKAALLGKSVRVLCPEPDASNHDTYMRTYIETRKPKVIGKTRNVVGMMKDGSLVPLNLTLSEQILGSNNLIFTAILRPLTEADQAGGAEAKSVMAAEREMIATLPVPAVMIDDKGLIQAFNEPAEQLWGYKLTEVVGRNVRMLMPAPDRDRHDGYIKRYLETGKHKVLGMGRDLVALHKDGSVIPVRLSVSEKKDGQRRIFTGIAQKLAAAP